MHILGQDIWNPALLPLRNWKVDEMVDASIEIGESDKNPFNIQLEKLLTGRTAIIGQAGSGKSNLIGVICERLCGADQSFILIDTEGEYSSLKERFEIAWACNDDKADIRLDIESCKNIAERIVEQNARLILDTSESRDLEVPIVSEFLEYLYEIESKVRKPILVIIEEADRFIPQARGDDVQWVHEIARRGRKRGIGLAIATQRPAFVDKGVLSQCSNQMIGRLRIRNDIDAVRNFFEYQSNVDALPGLDTGEFFVMGELAHPARRVRIHSRQTTHQGATPTLSQPRRKFSVDELKKTLEGAKEAEKDRGKGIEPKAQENQIEPKIEAGHSEKSPPERAKQEERSSIRTEHHPRTEENIVTPQITILPFTVDEMKAHQIAEKYVTKSILGALKEHIEACETVYWPLLSIEIVLARRDLIGNLKVRNHNSTWDCVFSSCIRVQEDLSTKEIQSFCKEICEDDIDWKDIRVIRELSTQDMTIADLVMKTRINSSDVKKTVSRLLKRKNPLITIVGKSGHAPIYRPTLKVHPLKLSMMNSFKPEFKQTSALSGIRVPTMRLHEPAIRNIVKGLLTDEAEVLESTLFHMPVFLVTFRTKNTEETRAIRINGITGGVEELDGERMKYALH